MAAIRLHHSRRPAAADTRVDDAQKNHIGREYIDLYCARRGLPGIPIFQFALAFSFFRMAAIVQGVLKRGLDGSASNPDQALAMGAHVPEFARRGLEAAG